MSDSDNKSRNSRTVSGNNRVSRRTILQSSGVSLSLIGLSGIGSSNQPQSKEEVYREAHEIWEETGDAQQYKNYLENHGFDVSLTQSTFSHPSHSSSEISPNRIKDNHMTGTLSLIEPGLFSDAFADYKVEVQSGKLIGPGERPNDYVTISWPSSDYDLEPNGAAEEGGNVLLNNSTFNGATWTWDDVDACHHGCDLSFRCSVSLSHLSSSSRKIQATYQSAWGDNTAGLSISFSSDGTISIGITGSGSINYEQLDRSVVYE